MRLSRGPKSLVRLLQLRSFHPKQNRLHDVKTQTKSAAMIGSRGISKPTALPFAAQALLRFFSGRQSAARNINDSGLCLGQFLEAFPPAFCIGQEVLVTAKGYDEQAGSLLWIMMGGVTLLR